MKSPSATVLPCLTSRGTTKFQKPRGNPAFRFPRGLVRLFTLTVFVALVATLIYSPSSASSSFRFLSGNLAPTASQSLAPRAGDRTAANWFGANNNIPTALSTMQATPVESIATFAADCVTPKSNFLLGETVCVRVESDQNDRFINWIKDNAVVRGDPDLTPVSGNQTFPTFDRIQIPTSTTTVGQINGTPTVVNTVGLWKVTIASPTDSSILPASFSVAAAPPNIALYEAAGVNSCNMAAPRTTFILGETACAVVNNVDPNARAQVNWVGTAGDVKARSAFITNGTLQSTFLIPLNSQIGAWKANINSITDGSQSATITFNVSNPQQPSVDLAVSKLAVRPLATAGSDFVFQVTVTNLGPDDATGVQLSDLLPANTTFVSLTQSLGPGFSCAAPNVNGTSVCTGALAAGESADFLATYTVNTNTPEGTIISGTANVANTANGVTERNAANNSSTDTAPVHVEPCVLTCPADIDNVPNTPNQFDAVVNFPAQATGSGPSCGTITYNPASGSVFPVGTTIVTVSGQAGNPCSFNVTVVDTQAPTITTVPDITVTENPSGSGSAIVNYAPPTSTDNDPIPPVVACDRPSGSAFPVGETIVTCTATDRAENFATSTFKVTVTGTNPSTCQLSCPDSLGLDPDALIIADSNCQANVNYNAPTETTGCTVTKTAGPASGGSFPIGTTTVTYKATDSNNLSTTCSFTVTVVDRTGPPLTNTPANVVVNAPAGSCEANVSQSLLTPPTAQPDSCSNPVTAVTGERDDNLPLNAPYPVGVTNISWEARDKVGNGTVHIQTVTVKETVPPTVNVQPIASEFADQTCFALVPDVVSSASYSDNCTGQNDLIVVQSPAAGTAVGVGAHPVTVTVTDSSGNSASDTETFNVIDNSPPSITAPADVTFYTGPNATSCDVTVTNAQLGTPTTQDNCAVTVTRTPSGNTFPKGETTIVWKVTDAGGNEATAQQKVTVIDNTPPAISCPTDIVQYLPLNSPAVSMVVNYTAPTGTDNCAGSTTTQTAGLPSGSIFPVGTTTNTFKVTDAAGNTTECSFTVSVLYNFTGFFNPVSNPPVLNAVNAGRAIPVKFSLSGNKGLNIFAAGYPATVSFNCATNDPGVDVTETLTAGGSSLTYAGGDQYHYVWKTESSWAGTCRQLIIKLNDGTTHVANFKFK